MKSLKERIIESLLDDEDEVFDGVKENIIKEFLETNYKIRGSYTIKEKGNKFTVDVKGDISAKTENIVTLTNEFFEFGKVSGFFNCSYCDSLKSLEGAPKEVSSSFYCHHCALLKSLKGAPEEVGNDFECTHCDSLTSLKGAPKKVGGSFYCYRCALLKSLEGAPKKVGFNFDCGGCKSLTSLKGAPKEVGKDFYCNDCGEQFTEEDVRKYIKVAGAIWM